MEEWEVKCLSSVVFGVRMKSDVLPFLLARNQIGNFPRTLVLLVRLLL